MVSDAVRPESGKSVNTAAPLSMGEPRDQQGRGIRMDQLFFAMGAVFGFLGVALGAMGAHALQGKLSPERLTTYELAARYQLFHALALLGAAWAAARWPGGAATAAGWLLAGGIVLFSGSLYGLSFGGPRWMAFVTPFGGVSFLVGWACLVWTAVRG